MGRRVWSLAARLAALAVAFLAPSAFAATPVYDAQIVKAYPHDPGAFTEGLFYRGGYLYESTGLNGHSFIRKVDLASGRVLQSRALAPQYFGEGIVAVGGKLVQLTWISHVGFIYDLASFRPLSRFTYPGEGWALTSDGHHLIMSDGTPQLRILDPTTLKEERRITVTADGQPVSNLNELEWVKGELLANIWMTDRIARIDPATGHVTGWIDVSALAQASGAAANRDAVPNGIAYDAAGDRLFVTGKLWPKLFQITLTPESQGGR